MTTTTLTEARRNLAPNPRAGVTLAGWAMDGAGGATGMSRRDGDTPVPGGTFARIEWGAPSTAAGGGIILGGATDGASAIPVVPGQRITVSVYARPSRERVLGLSASFYTAAGSLIAGGGPVPDSEVGPVPPGEWQRLTAGLVPPATAARVRITPRSAAAADRWSLGDYLDVTGLLVEADAVVGDYFDGGTLAPPGQLHTWGGQPHASASLQLRLVQQSTQLLTPSGAVVVQQIGRATRRERD